MTTILCYGDSNTYGYNPVNGLRYPKDVRWTGVLQKLLGEQYAVIEAVSYTHLTLPTNSLV